MRMRIGSGYSNTSSVTAHIPGTARYVTFPVWTALERGPNPVSCSAALIGDCRSDNDRRTGTATVRVLDVAAKAILAPIGVLDSGVNVIPQARVRNLGTTPVSFPVTFRIAGLYSDSRNVSDLPAGESTLVNFQSWIAAPRGTHVTRCTTALPGDLVPDNNATSGLVTVQTRDIGVLRIIVPAGDIDSGTSVVPACSVCNYGSTTASYCVRLRIGWGYEDTARVSGHASGVTVGVTFRSWTAGTRGSYPVSCSTELAADQNPGNDRLLGNVAVQVHDVTCAAIFAPSGRLDSGAVVAPVCTVASVGTRTENYLVRLRIGASYTATVPVTAHEPGMRLAIAFPEWVAQPRGTWVVACSTELEGDQQPTNDRALGSVTVVVHDVAARAIIAPADTIPPGAIIPQALVRNFGTGREPLTVTYTINAVPPYQSQLDLATGLPVGIDTILSFASWSATTGDYFARCSVSLALDQNRTNDVVSASFTVRSIAAGWTAMAELPAGPKSKKVKDGGCLAYFRSDRSDPSDGSDIYCLKGNNCSEFYKYNTATNTWATKESIPILGSAMKKKAVKKGACMTA
ncbi:MAG: hypothetical protein ABIK62_04990, partial [candidate division WOR-3 bacterium]